MQLRRPRPPGEAIDNVRRLLQNVVARRPEPVTDPSPLDLDRDRVVLLYFEDAERDRFVRGDRLIRRAARRVYHALTYGTTVSGFEVAFLMLVEALRRAGFRVRVNDRAIALRNPAYPVGLSGYPHVLDVWDLPNPAVLGPGLFDHPSLAPRLFDDPRVRSYLVPCGWMQDLFERAYGPRCPIWFAGIDVVAWPDAAQHDKDVDLVVYDKIRWDREIWVPAILDPVLSAARGRGLRVEVVRYGRYDREDYKRLLLRSRGMVFVCEHEAQGLAYQEAMACNVPILAWSNGGWLDPNRRRYGVDHVPASSVPYFSPDCGETFADAAELGAAMDRFLARLPGYRPRRYVQDHLSFEESAARYLAAYRAARQP